MFYVSDMLIPTFCTHLYCILRYLVLSTEKERKEKIEAEKAQREREKTLNHQKAAEEAMVDRTFVGKFTAQDVDFDKLDVDQDPSGEAKDDDEEEEEEEEEEEIMESKVGETLSQLTTQRVISIILLMLFVVHLLETPTIDRRDETAALLMHSFAVANASFFNTQNITSINASSALTQDAYRAITGVIAETNSLPFGQNQLTLKSLQIGNIVFPVPNPPTIKLRNVELSEFRLMEKNGTDVLLETKALFTARQVVRESGMWNMLLTLFATAMLIVAAYITSNDVVRCFSLSIQQLNFQCIDCPPLRSSVAFDTAYTRPTPCRGHGPDHTRIEAKSFKRNYAKPSRTENIQKWNGNYNVVEHYHQNWWNSSCCVWSLWSHHNQGQPQRRVRARSNEKRESREASYVYVLHGPEHRRADRRLWRRSYGHRQPCYRTSPRNSLSTRRRRYAGTFLSKCGPSTTVSMFPFFLYL